MLCWSVSSLQIKKLSLTDPQRGIINGYRPSFECECWFHGPVAGYHYWGLYKLANTAEAPDQPDGELFRRGVELWIHGVETWDGLQTGEYVGERGYGGGDSVRRTGGC